MESLTRYINIFCLVVQVMAIAALYIKEYMYTVWKDFAKPIEYFKSVTR